MLEFVRRTIDLSTPTGKGQVALLDFGDQNRAIDIIFSNANGFNALTYRHILAPLAADLRIVAYDSRGHGHTTLPAQGEGRVDWRDMGADLGQILATLKPEQPVVLAGHSMGASTSLMAAQHIPSAVKALVLFDPVLVPRRDGVLVPESPLTLGALRRRRLFESRQAAVDSWRGRGAFRNWPDEILVDYATDGLLDDRAGVRLACAPEWAASNYRAQGQDGPALLFATGHATDVLKAETGSTCLVATNDPRLANHPLIRMTEIGGTSHFLPMERPDLVRERLRAAVAR